MHDSYNSYKLISKIQPREKQPQDTDKGHRRANLNNQQHKKRCSTSPASNQGDVNKSHNKASFHIHQNCKKSRVIPDVGRTWGQRVQAGRAWTNIAGRNVNYYRLLGNSLNASIKILKRSLTQQLHSQGSIHRNKSTRTQGDMYRKPTAAWLVG